MAATGFAPAGGPRRRARVRLTRRGRVLAVVLLAVLYLLLSAAVVAVGATASRASDPAGPPRTVVVGPGDTLWAVAERHLPGSDPWAAVERIRSINDIDGYTVHPGQELTLPAPGR